MLPYPRVLGQLARSGEGNVTSPQLQVQGAHISFYPLIFLSRRTTANQVNRRIIFCDTFDFIACMVAIVHNVYCNNIIVFNIVSKLCPTGGGGYVGMC